MGPRAVERSRKDATLDECGSRSSSRRTSTARVLIGRGGCRTTFRTGAAGEFHVYAAEWTHDSVGFLVDHQVVKTSGQSPAYPMQLMLGIYEFPQSVQAVPEDAYPMEFAVDYVRGYHISS